MVWIIKSECVLETSTVCELIGSVSMKFNIQISTDPDVYSTKICDEWKFCNFSIAHCVSSNSLIYQPILTIWVSK